MARVVEEATFAPSAQALFSELDAANAIVVHVRTKKVFSLNETGILIWKGLALGLLPSDLAVRLADTYELAETDALQSVMTFVEQLQQQDLLEPTPMP